MEPSIAIQSLPSLRLTVEAHGLLAKKNLGQNFLLDSNITDKIISKSLHAQKRNSFSGSQVFEIGPGPGGLTRSIIKSNPDQITVIELDERCIKIMEEIKTKLGDMFNIINQDALTYDFTINNSLPKHLISNLPYNISVPLLTTWLKDISQ